jgi:N-acetyl-gamma-glutamyl-phosphate reductase common form
MGGEALRVLLGHPQVELAWATSRTPGPVELFHPNLYGSGITLVHPDDVGACDVAFLALPTSASIPEARRLIDAGCRVIDLGSAFRLKDRALWERIYGQSHSDWSLAEEAVYGVNELHAAEIAAARVIANPGCFASAAILAFAPLLQEGLVRPRELFVSGLSGTAGVGAELARPAHHPEIGNNLVAYNVVDHRHTYEAEQELGALAAEQVVVHFTPVYVPITRGILDVCSALLTRSATRARILELYRDYYAASPFVQIYDMPKDSAGSWQYRPYPWVSAVATTNFCQIGLDVDETRGRVVVLSALDNMGKGGAQVGIENMNIMFGLDRTAGLSRPGAHPA